MTALNDLPTQLKKFRKRNHYSQEYVAEYLNLSRQAISNWETGKTVPDIEYLIMLSKLYNTTIDDLCNNKPMDAHQPNETSAFNKISYTLELICVFLILFLSAHFPFLSLIAPICIFFWQLKSNKRNPLIFVMCILCFAIGIYNTYIFYIHISPNNGDAFIEQAFRTVTTVL